jgi:hypothetical protein
MDYYESAEGLLITLNRVEQELERHGFDEVTEFTADVAPIRDGLYSAQHLLEWLGY